MAGHSKWAQIKRSKAKVDAARGAVFTKMSREIIVAARMGGGDPAGNFRLRTAIEAARKAGVPNDNIKRAISKGVGAEGADALEEIQYEGYGPSGVAILVRAFTDNRNRTAADLRAAFGKNGGNLGETGCVGFLFAECGQIVLDNEDDDLTEDAVLEAALEGGADDVREAGGTFEVISKPADLEAVQNALTASGFKIESAGVVDLPSTTVRIDDPDTARKVLRLMERLDELDDVQKVAANFDVPDEVLAEIEATMQ
ncbi:MAG: YebC/PmpR family DNA-binding transcriptional regulator [Candidatus Sericytochromatia bacterium]|uniref:Probable transcriptional regulatory protein FJZ00_06820 n=1 Tax=Candidatus Tanganyikabacteria bacterium TaxID=2961651 RepID=A0A937X751_9BACT|nr:YebC/PmpR family DNA-binding transcriptional regulator [Candidatus Tanganyikabacteria bacterium]